MATREIDERSNATAGPDPGCSAAFVEQHARIDALMAQHQEALVRLDLPEARRLYAAFRTALHEHMETEERDLLPAYDRLGRWEAAGAPDLMRAEHRQTRLLVDQIAAELLEIDARDGLTPARVIRFIEDERRLKGVMEHHHCRDERYLYPCAGGCRGGAGVSAGRDAGPTVRRLSHAL